MNIQNFLKFHQNQHIIIGLSGGVDSVVLLHLLAQARQDYGLTLTAVHVHHGLSANADAWAAFCANLCQAWQIPFHIKYVQIQSAGLGVEAAARAARYQVLQAWQGDCLALAHHQDDQVETFFLAALRGAGVRGLAAMEYTDDSINYPISGSLKIVRPLLQHTRAEIERYATQHQLQHIEDESNFNPIYLRNWLRHDWLPALRQRLPHANRHLLTAIATLQDELSILNEINELDYQHICPQHYFRLDLWRELSPARRRQQLVLFAKNHRLGTPRRASILDFERILLDEPNVAEWALPHGTAYAYRNILFALSNNWQENLIWANPISGSLQNVMNTAQLIAHQTITLPDGCEQVTLRSTQPHDRLGKNWVKKILQNHHVPPFLRPHYPVLVAENGEVLAVLNLVARYDVGGLPKSEFLAQFLL